MSRVRRDALALGVGTGVYGISFGALSVTAGLSGLQTQVLSLLMFTGGSQFALVGVLASGGSAIAAVSVAWLLGLRNTLYSLRVGPLAGLRLDGPLRAAAGAHLVIDESTAMATNAPSSQAREAFFATGIAIFVLWNFGTLLGALATSFAPDPKALGLDVAFPAAFVALLAPRLRTDPTVRPVAVLGAVIALTLTPLTPPGVPVLAAALAIVPVLLRFQATGGTAGER